VRRGGASRAVAGGSSAISCGDSSAPPAAFSADVPGAKAPQDFMRTLYSVSPLSTLLSESPTFTPAKACVGGGPAPRRCRRRLFEGGLHATAASIGREIRRTCSGSLTARGPGAPRDHGAPGVAFRCLHSVGTPKLSMAFAAQFPAHTYPCQRFATALTNGHA